MPYRDGHWFITGASSGFGRALAHAVIAVGGRVTATARNTDKISDLAGASCGIMKLDVAEPGHLPSLIAKAEADRGAIDVLVNSAGVGLLATAEAATETEIRRLFEVNVFGLAAVTRAMLAGMRARRRGAIINISSIAGVRALAGSAYYGATKFAVEGLSEALRGEVSPFGIRVMVVQPAAFRTAFLTSETHAAREIEDYAPIMDARRARMLRQAGRQAGDPERAAAAIIAALDRPTAPERLPLGGATVPILTKKLRAQIGELEAWAGIAAACDFPEE